ncbi:hypothetical protein CC79DRAFT_1352104 [Sarocladium strictum]
MDDRIIKCKDDLSEEEKTDLLHGIPGSEDPEYFTAEHRNGLLDCVFREWDTTIEASESPSLDVRNRPIEGKRIWGEFTHDFPDTSNPSICELPEWRRKGAKVYIHCVLDRNLDDDAIQWHFRDEKFTAIDPFKGVDTYEHEDARYYVTVSLITRDETRCFEFNNAALRALLQQRLRNLCATTKSVVHIPQWQGSYSPEAWAGSGNERSWRIDHPQDEIELFYHNALPHVPWPRIIAKRSDLFVMERWEIVLDLLQEWKSQELPEPAMVTIDTITLEDRDKAIDMIFGDNFQAVHINWGESADRIRKPKTSILQHKALKGHSMTFRPAGCVDGVARTNQLS